MKEAKMQQIFFFVLLFISVINASYRCYYSDERRLAICKGFTNIGDLKNVLKGVESLVMSHNEELNYPSKFHEDVNVFGNLQAYVIKETNRLNIQEYGLSGLNVRKLEIHHNYYPTVRNNTFQGLKKLTTLELNSNNISYIEGSAFAGLSSVKNLILSENDLTSLQNDVFPNCTELAILSLSNNLIKKINRHSLRGLSSIEDINFSHNKLEHLNAEIFNELKTLITLNFEHNEIASISGEFDLPSLRFLSLGNNNLVQIESNLFKNLPNLIDLDFSKNAVQIVEDGAFMSLQKIMNLNCFGNKVNSTGFKFPNKPPIIHC